MNKFFKCFLFLFLISITINVKALSNYVLDFKMTWDDTEYPNSQYKTANMLEIENGYLIVGNSFGAGDNADVLKLNENGEILWQTPIPVSFAYPKFPIIELEDKSIVVGINDNKYFLDSEGNLQEQQEKITFENIVKFKEYYFVHQFGNTEDEVLVYKDDELISTLSFQGSILDITTDEEYLYAINENWKAQTYEMIVINDKLESEIHTIKNLTTETENSVQSVDDSTLLKTEDAFYWAHPLTSGIYKIDKDYNAEKIIPFTSDDYIDNETSYRLDLNSITYKEEYFIVGGSKCYDDSDYNWCKNEANAIIRIYDENFSLLEEIIINDLFDYQVDINKTSIVSGENEVNKIISTEKGFLVGGALVSKNEDSLLSSEAFVVYYTFEHEIETKTDGNGNITVSTNKSVSDEDITFTINPKEGYVLGELKIYDENGNVIEPTSKENSFTMPYANVTIEATFIPENPDTSSMNLFIISCITIIILGIYLTIKNIQQVKWINN